MYRSVNSVRPVLKPVFELCARACSVSGAAPPRAPGDSRLPLRLLQFQNYDGTGQLRVGAQVVEGPNSSASPIQGEVVDITAALPNVGRDVKRLLESGEVGQHAVRQAIESGKHRLDVANVRLCAPITKPDKIICVGLNYQDHCAEFNLPVPEEPTIFSKLANALAGPADDIVMPKETEELDFEAELAIVIGRKGRHIPASEALAHVAGYTVAHDVSARDWQLKKNSGQWLLGKSFDGFCPIGPVIVTPQALSDPHKLGIRCRVNNVTLQNSNTDQLIYKTSDIIEFVSRFITLAPGDLLLTGTPSGIGATRRPPVFLQKGDVVECEIDGIGCIKNAIV